MTKKARARRSFTDEFKNQIVQLYINGKRKSEIIREYYNKTCARQLKNGISKEKRY
jgi:transposase-like protein